MTALKLERDIQEANAALQVAYAAEEDRLRDKGYRVVPKLGTAAWLDFIADCRSNINSSFRPFIATRDNSRALFLMDTRGQTVGAIAMRAYDVSDHHEFFSTGRMWWTDEEAAAHDIEYVLPDDFPRIEGRVVQIGGLKIKDGHIGQRLGEHLDRMARYTAVLSFDAEHVVAMRMSDKIGKMDDYYGAARAKPAWKNLPIVGGIYDNHLTHINRQELLDSLMDRSHDNTVNLADFVGYAGGY